MDIGQVVDRINQLLDDDGGETTNTSMRIPLALRDAAALAVSELRAAPSTTALTNAALRTALEAIALQAALDLHYDGHPHARPTLTQLAVAAAELDGHPLAARHDLLHRAATEIIELHPDADADAVLVWAEAQAAASA